MKYGDNAQIITVQENQWYIPKKKKENNQMLIK